MSKYATPLSTEYFLISSVLGIVSAFVFLFLILIFLSRCLAGEGGACLVPHYMVAKEIPFNEGLLFIMKKRPTVSGKLQLWTTLKQRQLTFNLYSFICLFIFFQRCPASASVICSSAGCAGNYDKSYSLAW
jgi:hypothetical protein